jgi:Na+/proline symporter
LYTVSKGGVYTDVEVGGKMVKQLLVADPHHAGQTLNVIGDKMFPSIAMNFLPPAISIIFIIALISALFPSADGALTALTSSFCIDMLGLQKRTDLSEKVRRRTRLTVHFTFAFIFLACIMVFYLLNNNSIIDIILDLAGYTYGPLLGLFSFGILTKRKIPDTITITIICLLAPVLSYFLAKYAKDLFGGYQIGIELLIINGILTFLGLLFISRKQNTVQASL